MRLRRCISSSAETLDAIIEDIRRIEDDARRNRGSARPRWPMIILRTPKGWTYPKEIDGKRTDDYWRSHQVPMGEKHDSPVHVRILGMKSYKPEQLFGDTGRLEPELAALAPSGSRRMSANPHTNGGLLLRDLCVPDSATMPSTCGPPAPSPPESTRVMGKFLRDVMKLNLTALRDEFRVPGMRLLHFAFDGREDHPYRPHTYVSNAVVYAGTHDNLITRGRFRFLARAAADRVEVSRAHWCCGRGGAGADAPGVGIRGRARNRAAAGPAQPGRPGADQRAGLTNMSSRSQGESR